MSEHRYQEVQTTDGWGVWDNKRRTYVEDVNGNHFGTDMIQRDAHDLAVELEFS